MGYGFIISVLMLKLNYRSKGGELHTLAYTTGLGMGRRGIVTQHNTKQPKRVCSGLFGITLGVIHMTIILFNNFDC